MLRQYFFSFENIFEIITIFPYLILVSSFYNDPDNYSICFARMLDLLRIASLFRLSKHIETDINRELSYIVLGVSTLVIWFTGYI
jgi:hypothetical protein